MESVQNKGAGTAPTAEKPAPKVLPDLTKTPATAKVLETKPAAVEPERRSRNGQKERTDSEERQAWVRRLKRLHKKAVIGIGLEATQELLMEAAEWDASDSAEASE
jgi:hypothetical protein